MYMKRYKILPIIFILVMVVVSFYFLWGKFNSAKPAILPSNKSITKIIENNNTPKTAINNTDFPLTLPKGFSIDVFAKNLNKVRVLKTDPNGTIVASIIDKGKVVALPDKNKDGKADEEISIVENLNNPHGIEFKDNKIYIAETNALAVFDYNSSDYKASNKQKLIDLPGGGRHFTRTLLFNPKNSDELLISIGSSCDVCIEQNGLRGTIQSYNIKTGELRQYAEGLRNSVFMTVKPDTQEVWATEMGRDNLGNNIPPDEINIIKEGSNYGWPYLYGKNQEDEKFPFPSEKDVKYGIYNVPSHINIQAHSAPLGLAFIEENSDFPKDHWNNLLVSYHGSWNRTPPTGYKIERVVLDNEENEIRREDFISGWLQSDNSSLGRPVDILIKDKKEIYISDDKAGVIYVVTYK